MMEKHIVKDKNKCVHCGSAVKHEKVLCIMITDFHCLLPSCGYKDMRVIEHPKYDPADVQKAIDILYDIAEGKTVNLEHVNHLLIDLDGEEI